MNNPPSNKTNKTVGAVTFAMCGSQGRELFRVNPGVPIQEALEHVSLLLHCAKTLSQEAAMDADGSRYAWASHYLSEMGKAVIDDLTQAMLCEAVVSTAAGGCVRR
ncbi:DUF3077 domain-containing protein [Pseudomonas asplenii]|uniref:DUF3077 domain-containing protein n=1 Tax=Pseudomonas asplenii TaxID=53407 RepID=UPI0004960DF9